MSSGSDSAAVSSVWLGLDQRSRVSRVRRCPFCPRWAFMYVLTDAWLVCKYAVTVIDANLTPPLSTHHCVTWLLLLSPLKEPSAITLHYPSCSAALSLFVCLLANFGGWQSLLTQVKHINYGNRADLWCEYWPRAKASVKYGYSEAGKKRICPTVVLTEPIHKKTFYPLKAFKPFIDPYSVLFLWLYHVQSNVISEKVQKKC